MKRCLLVLVLLTVLVFFGCEMGKTAEKSPFDAENIEPMLAFKIKKDYCEQFEADYANIHISEYYGKFGESHVVQIAFDGKVVNDSFDPETEEIAGYRFVFDDSDERPLAYRNGEFFSLQEAYDNKVLTEEDIFDLGCRCGYWHVKNCINIETALSREMRYAYQKELSDRYGKGENWTFDKVWVEHYFGPYYHYDRQTLLSGCHIVYMGSMEEHSEELREEEIAGYRFVFGNGQPVYAYSEEENRFYTLQEAYEKGLLTKEEIYLIGTAVGIDFVGYNPPEK